MGKVKNLKERNPEFVIDFIDLFAEMDPTRTNKYVPYMVKKTKKYIDIVRKQMMSKNFQELFDLIQDFEDLAKRGYIEDKDIYKYNRLVDLREVVDRGRQEKDIKEIRKDKAQMLYKDEKYVLLVPITLTGSQIYGRSTKWCTAAINDYNSFGQYEHAFYEHIDNGKLLYLICRKMDPITQRFAKVAFYSKDDGCKYPTNIDSKEPITGWDVKDDKLTHGDLQSLFASLPTSVNKLIFGHFGM